MAEPVELKQMTFDIESALPGQFCLHFAQAATGEIDDFATTGANQMMVMFQGSSHHIAAAAVITMNSAYQTMLAEKLKSSIYSDFPYAGIHQNCFLIDIFRGEVVMA
jgi:hypothetical protein